MTTVDVGEQLKALIDLQEVDRALYDLRRRRRAKPAEIERLKAAYQQEVQRVKGLEEELKAIQVKRANLEGDLAAKEANVKKLQMQLYQVKTNKEYTAFQHEIEGLKADNSVLEEEILKLMEQVDQQKVSLAAVQAALKTKEAHSSEAVVAVEREIAELDAEIVRLQGQRQGIAPRVDSVIRARYERILEKKDGLGLVPIHAEQGTCGGCHMNLPPQTINEVRMKERLIACESCARLLYYPDDAAE